MKYVKIFEEYSTPDLFELYKKCIGLYRTAAADPKMDPLLDRIFRGSKISGDFIYRAAVLKGEPRRSEYDVYVKRHGENKVRNFLEGLEKDLDR